VLVGDFVGWGREGRMKDGDHHCGVWEEVRGWMGLMVRDGMCVGDKGKGKAREGKGMDGWMDGAWQGGPYS
jgi:hypothetical protein